MATVLTPPDAATVADLLEQLGNVSPRRVRLQPAPGTATMDDVIALARREKRLYELVDGTLVEKIMGYRESALASWLITMLNNFVIPRNLGIVTGEAGTLRLFGGLVRIPDVAFVAWEHVPGGRMPEEPVPELVPDLAVEVLREGNAPQEMRRKRSEYFAAGVRLVWQIDLRQRSVSVYTDAEHHVVLDESGTLEGGDVLPGFTLPLRELFAELDRTADH